MNELEMRARELLSAEYERDNYPVAAMDIRNGTFPGANYVRTIRAIVAALSQRPEGVVQPSEAVEHQYQQADGTWRQFDNQRHYENTVADGSWSIRALYKAPQQTAGVPDGWRVEQLGETFLLTTPVKLEWIVEPAERLHVLLTAMLAAAPKPEVGS